MKTLTQITKAKIIGAVLFTLILAGSLYLNIANSDDTPPDLSFESPGFQGLLKIKNGLKIFQDEDEDAHEDFIDDNDFDSEDSIEIKKGAAFYYVNKETSLEDIIFGIDPDAEGMIFAFYSPGETISGKPLEKGFHVYPKAPSSTATTKAITIEKPEEFKVPKGRGFILYTKAESIAYGFQPADEKADYTPYTYLADNQKGWVMVASNDNDLDDFITPVEDRIEKIFVQNKKDQIQTEKQKTDSYEFDDYYMVWLRLGEKAGATATPGNTSTQPNVKVTLTGQADDQKVDLNWEIDNKTAEISGYRLFRSSIVPILTVDQNKYKDFDKNTNKFSDTGLTNGTIYGYKILALDKEGKQIESSASKDMLYTPSKEAKKQFDDKELFKNLDEKALSLDLKADEKSIKLTFNKAYNIANLSKYKIFRSTSGNFTTLPKGESITELTDTKVNTYTDNISAPSYGQNYTYMVVAYDYNDKAIAKSPQKSTFLVKPKISDFAVKELFTDLGIFEWKEVPQATAYVIQIKENGKSTDEWAKEENTFPIWLNNDQKKNANGAGFVAKKSGEVLTVEVKLNKKIDPDKKYDFRIMPIILFLPDSNSAITDMKVSVNNPYVKNITFTTTETSLTVEWEEPETPVDKYHITLFHDYKCNNIKSYTIVNSATEGTVKNLAPETNQYFKVISYKNGYTFESDCIEAKTLIPTTTQQPVVEPEIPGGDKEPGGGADKIKTPEIIQVSQIKHNKFNVYWKIKGDQMIEDESLNLKILKVENSASSYSQLKFNLNGNKNDYVLASKTIQNNKTYRTTIEILKEYDEKQELDSKLSICNNNKCSEEVEIPKFTFYPKPQKVTNFHEVNNSLSFTNQNKAKFKVEWDKAPIVDGYEIEGSILGLNKKFTYLNFKDTLTEITKDPSLIYTLKIRSFYNFDDEKEYSEWSNPIFVKTYKKPESPKDAVFKNSVLSFKPLTSIKETGGIPVTKYILDWKEGAIAHQLVFNNTNGSWSVTGMKLPYSNPVIGTTTTDIINVLQITTYNVTSCAFTAINSEGKSDPVNCLQN